ncbi:MAG TPA: ammonium transporter [Dongiaceae bacterium]|nr:ammonium transporter [Dongiaceae bacterium]
MDTDIGALTIIFTEFYYWITVVFMFFIHIGFCMYEVGASRTKNHMHTLMKNTMLIPVVAVTFYLFGWWIYFAFVNGPGIIDGGVVPAPWATPWSELMGAHMGGKPASDALTAADTAFWARINGTFWAAFLLFSWTAASIVSGAVIERIRSFSFWIIAVMIGSVTWMIDAAWGWHPQGWMVKVLGYHDAYASGVIHAIAGGTALAVLINLGPRIGKFKADGTPRNIVPQNPWLITIGLFLIYAGFWGFYVACNVPILDVQPGDGVFYSSTNIYLQPTTLSAITFNFLMSLSGGLMAAYIVSRGDPFWTYSGGLAGVIGTSAGNDLYHPIQAMILGGIIAAIVYKLHYWVERRFKIDDVVGAVAVHGYGGFLGVVAAGFLLWGYPSSPDPSFAPITPWGQFIGAVIMFFVLGFIPGYVLSWILKAFGVLRIPREIELVGLDLSEYAARYMDEDDVKKAELEEARATGLLR